MSILTFEGLSTTFKALANVSLAIYIPVSDNLCTKVTSKTFSSNTKSVRHTCNCIVYGLEM